MKGAMTVAVFAMIAAASASAQAPRQMPAPGDTVRVWAMSPPLEGERATVRRVARDTLVFSLRSAVSREGPDTPVEMRSLQRLEVRDGAGTSRKCRVIGYATGSVLGLAAGAYLTYRRTGLYCDPGAPCVQDVESGEAIGAVFGIIIGGIAGATIGGGIGWAIGSRPVERWRQVYP